MKKFNQYLKPEQKKKNLSLTEKAWLGTKKKIEEEQKQSELNKLEEQKKEEELRKKLYVEKIVDVNIIREEFVGKNIIEEEFQLEEVIPEPQPLIEQIVIQGEPGPQGPQGLKGDQGERGEKGERGESGTPGIRGLTGNRGEKGDIGPQGIQGEQGIPGRDGVDGKEGPPGPKGEQGIPGRDGVDGKEGPPGPKGDTGDRGEKGQDGKDGLNGKDGRDGQDGKPGPKGDRGDRGEQGPQGPKGDKGDKGDAPDLTPFAEKFNKLSLDINKKVGRIVGDMGALAGGGGSGSYWLNDLGDTDYSGIVNATDGQVLTYSNTLKKWTAADSQGGVGTIDSYARIHANAAFDKANSANVLAQSSYDFANTVNTYSYSAYSQANSAAIIAQAAFNYANTIISDTQIDQTARNIANSGLTLAQSSYNYANTINVKIDSSYAFANTVNVKTDSAYAFANTVNVYAYSAYAQSNTTATTAQAAFDRANSANVIAQSSYNFANTVNTYAYSAYAFSNTVNTFSYSVNTKAQAAFDKANTAITTSGGTITGQLNVNYTPATTEGAALTITAANTKGGTSYADVLQLTNSSAGATSPNKYIRINNIGTLEIINSAYTSNPLSLSDVGDLSVSGNVTSAGIKSGYSSGRPGFRVVGGGTTNNLTITQNGTGQLNSNNWTVIFNQGSYLNNTTGTFTAPVEGLYQVNVVGRNSGYSSGISQLAVRQNNDVVVMIEWVANSTMNHVGGSAVVKMAVGDTLKLFVLAGQVNFDQNDNWSVAYIG